MVIFNTINNQYRSQSQDLGHNCIFQAKVFDYYSLNTRESLRGSKQAHDMMGMVCGHDNDGIGQEMKMVAVKMENDFSLY